MRRAGLLAVSAAVLFGYAAPVSATDPDDVPWDEIDRLLKEAPPSAADARREGGEDDTIVSPDGFADDRAATPEPWPSDVDDDRLAPQERPPAAASTDAKADHEFVRDDPEPGPISRPDITAMRPDGEAPATSPDEPAVSPAPGAPVPDAARDDGSDGRWGGAPDDNANGTTETPAKDETTAPSKPADAAQSPRSAPASSQEPTPAKPQATPTSPATDVATPKHDQIEPSAKSPTGATVVAHGNILYLPASRYLESKGATTLAAYPKADRDALSQFYSVRMGQAIWLDRTGVTAEGKALIAELGQASSWGLRSGDYKIPALDGAGSGALDETALTDAELKLSLAALAYANDARGARISDPATQLSSYLDRKPNAIDRKAFIEGLASAADKAAFLRDQHPKHEQFQRLRQKLLALRAAAPSPEPIRIPDGPKIMPGKSHPHVALIRERLKVPVPEAKPDGSPPDANYYDSTLEPAVIAFKEKNEIEPANATINNAVRKAFNKPETVSEATLVANMEQWRWMPDDLGATHIEVNIPEFMVRVVKDGTVIHAERIVSGKRETQTPIFSDRMSTVVFQPSWNVPDSIKINELLPSLRYGGNPISRQGLVLQRNGRTLDAWDVDWYRADIRNYHIFQPPGDSNVLGVVKFLFPNKHAVYLHDTPSKHLFNEKVRTFSHGCMRVRNPVRLAEVVLAEDKGWDKETVDDIVRDGPADNDVTLDKPLPVHVTYFTAWVEADGEVKTFGDVYGHERRVRLALEGRWNEIDKNRDHLLPPDDTPAVARNRYDDWDDFRGGRQRYSGPYYSSIEPPRGLRRKPKGFFDQLFGMD